MKIELIKAIDNNMIIIDEFGKLTIVSKLKDSVIKDIEKVIKDIIVEGK